MTTTAPPAAGGSPAPKGGPAMKTTERIEAPMGGMRSSGLGRRQGIEGVLRFTDTQSVATQRLTPIAPRFGLSDRAYGAVMTTGLRVMKKLGRA